MIVSSACRYMDPGNWATNIAGGASFGYTLIIVIFLSSVTAMFLQFLSLKLGVVASRDLAQACRDSYKPWVTSCPCHSRWQCIQYKRDPFSNPGSCPVK
jgi:NRAMP (natural resistance-associated macrophage protein)-like metal ion transporter